MKYRKKPVLIDAIRYLGEPGPILDWLKVEELSTVAWKPDTDPQNRYVLISTLEGVMTCSYGDWIIRGVKGELYPCKHDIFEMTYELADEKEAERVKDIFKSARESIRPIL